MEIIRSEWWNWLEHGREQANGRSNFGKRQKRLKNFRYHGKIEFSKERIYEVGEEER
jgi:hypothetical protein